MSVKDCGEAVGTMSGTLKNSVAQEAPTNLERIKPEELNRIWDEVTLEDIEYLAREFPGRVCVNCVACSSPDYQAVYQKLGYTYNRCHFCDSLFISPRLPKEGIAYFFRHSKYTKFAESVYQTVAEERKRIIFEPRWRKLKAALLGLNVSFPIENFLEVGASLGLFASVVIERGDVVNFDAIEPSSGALQHLKRVGIRNVFTGMEEEYVGKLAAIYDIVLCNSAMEVTFSPEEFIRNLKTFLKPGGLLVLSSPGASGVDSLLLQEAQQNANPPHGQNYISNQGMQLLAERCDLQLVEFASIGSLDVDIVLDHVSSRKDVDQSPFLKNAAKILGNAQFREGLQALLQKHGLTGVYLAILRLE
ncbi:MAG: hypothetical protein A3G87_05920 [Omnitrophica bacterium RIFCSPLOWO2_12_FULL_50_11]|nr:MAG: hypothetical protein A3G87_05920 [Omnitrophica bacterium RIFCSPLOWO2_12_FULL_50_11]